MRRQKPIHWRKRNRHRGSPIPEEIVFLLLPIAVVGVVITVIRILSSNAPDDTVTEQLEGLGFTKEQIAYFLRERRSYQSGRTS